MLGYSNFNSSKSSSKFLQSVEKSIQSDLNKAASDVAKALNIHDFYSAHVLDYCEGYYTPSPVVNLTSDPSKNTTNCSNHTALFHFDPATIIQKELKPGVNLTDLKWPSAVQDGIRGVELASKAMFVIYCIGAGAVGVTFIGTIIAISASGRFIAAVNFMTSMVSRGPQKSSGWSPY